ncbi:MAG TPA: FAD-binding protein, partial [Terracidiphilus sp.]
MKMSKRAFLKTTGATVAAGMLGQWSAAQQAAPAPQTQPQTPAAPPAPPPEPLHNWAGNITYSTTSVEMPATMDEVCEAVKTATKLRAVGSRHSFNTIADSTVELFSVKQIKDIAIDTKAETVTVGGGVSYGQLALVLDSKGYALHNLASLPHISVAGAIATATHGSGLNNGNLATAVTGLEIVTAEGKIAQLTREKDGDAFLGAVVGLGALGVVTHVTLKLQPSYDVAQAVYLNLPFDVLEHNFDKVFGAGYSVSLFTDWQNHRATQMWLKHRLRPDEQNVWNGDFMGAPMATENVHPITGHSA